MIEDNAEMLNTPVHIKKYIEFCLEEVSIDPKSDCKTAAYQWKEWNNGKQKKVSSTSSH